MESEPYVLADKAQNNKDAPAFQQPIYDSLIADADVQWLASFQNGFDLVSTEFCCLRKTYPHRNPAVCIGCIGCIGCQIKDVGERKAIMLEKKDSNPQPRTTQSPDFSRLRKSYERIPRG
jgi:hypothetical protein